MDRSKRPTELVRPVDGTFGPRAALAVVVLCLAACTEVRKPPPPPVPAQPVAEAPRAPSRNPSQVQKLPERSWGVNQRRAGTQGQSASGETLNGDPGGLRQDQLQASLQAALPKLSQCFVGSEATSAVVSFEAYPSGSPRDVVVRGPPETQECLRLIFEGHNVPPFSGNPVHIDYPISVHRQTEVVKETRLVNEAVGSEAR